MTKKPIKTKFLSKKIIANRNSRILAIQGLYLFDINPDLDYSQIIFDLLETHDLMATDLKNFQEYNKKYLISLVKNTLAQLNIIDEKISQYLTKEWRLERLPKLVKAILRIGAYEVLNPSEVQVNMLIDNYLEIAKIFDHSGEVGFINSILDKILKEEK